MICEVCIDNDQVTVTLSGTIDVDVATSMKERLFPLIEKGSNHFIFCVHNVDYIESSGLGIFVVIQKKVAQIGGKVVLRGLTGKTKEIFESTKLTRVFEMQ